MIWWSLWEKQYPRNIYRHGENGLYPGGMSFILNFCDIQCGIFVSWQDLSGICVQSHTFIVWNFFRSLVFKIQLKTLLGSLRIQVFSIILCIKYSHLHEQMNPLDGHWCTRKGFACPVRMAGMSRSKLCIMVKLWEVMG